MKIIITSVLLLISMLAFQQESNETKVGNKAPDFGLETIKGDKILLSELYKKQPVVLIVLRGWPGYQCPICTRQVGGLVADEGKFKNTGAAVLIVYPGPADDLLAHAKEFSEDFDFPENFYFTLDPDYSMINKYGLRWIAPRETAYPSTIVINKNGTIIFSKISTTHGDRASNDEILVALNK
jgi:peroxiredoxin Q/BCP